jgi:ADP-heptose:LPS heptosyltransferase
MIVQTPRTILVYVGLDLMGDGLMKMPFVRALRETYPEARITWLAGKGPTVFAECLAPLVRGQIDEVIESADIGSEWTELFRRPLPDRHFDLVIDTQRRVLTTLILRRLRCGRFISGTANFLLSSNRPARGYKKPATMIRQILDLIELAAGQRIEERIAPLYDAASDEIARQFLPDGPVYVGLSPGAGGQHKCWPRDRFVEVARRQISKGRVPVVFLGPAEAAWYQELRNALPSARFPLQDGERLSPLVTIALAARLAAAVANDSGGGHLLAAGGVPLISLWGPTVMTKAPPQTKRLITILAQQFGGSSMEAIPVDAVDAALETLLSNAGVSATAPAVSAFAK